MICFADHGADPCRADPVLVWISPLGHGFTYCRDHAPAPDSFQFFDGWVRFEGPDYLAWEVLSS